MEQSQGDARTSLVYELFMVEMSWAARVLLMQDLFEGFRQLRCVGNTGTIDSHSLRQFILIKQGENSVVNRNKQIQMTPISIQ